MTNHYHLLIETPDANLSKGMRQLNGVYTQRFNQVYQTLRARLPWPLQGDPGAEEDLPERACAPHRSQPGEGADGGRGAGLALE
jgi:REP element-mobilizing transposase RayT